MSATLLDVEAIRRRYSSLQSGFAFFDAPGGTQVPDEVGEAIARTLREASANLGAPYETGQRVEAVLTEAKQKGAGFLGCTPDEVVFGMNMTTVNFALSRTAGRDWREGDEVIVTRLDHDGCAAPWVELAADKGMKVQLVDVNDDLTLDFDDLERKLSDRTRVVACSIACNAVGTLVDVERLCSLAREAGALSWLDAVHYAAHETVDVVQLGCDVLICSPYKFCGPHLGLGYVRRELAETWRPVQGAARPDPAARAPLRDRHAALRAARRLQRDDRLPRRHRRDGGDPRVRARARPAVHGRAARLGHGVRAADDGGPRAHVPRQRRRRLGLRRRGRARGEADGRLGPRRLVLRRARRAAAGRGVGADRLHPLQHDRRGRPPRRRAGSLSRRRGVPALRR